MSTKSNAGGKPSKGTPKDKRLKDNKSKAGSPAPSPHGLQATRPGDPLPKDW